MTQEAHERSMGEYDTLRKRLVNVFFTPATPEEIKQLEEVVGLLLPPSYRRFLELVSNGALLFQTRELYGTKDGDTSKGPTVQTSIATVHAKLPPEQRGLTPFHFSNDMLFFDPKHADATTGEQPVVSFNNESQTTQQIAPDFLSWLEDTIKIFDND